MAAQYTLALNDKDADRSVALAVCRELKADGGLPDWIELLPPGEKIIGADGRGFKNPDPEAVVANSGTRIDVPIDWEHATESAGMFGGKAPAAGWISQFETREGGSIWGKVDWTPKGAESVKGREYRYVSPAFRHREGEVIEIVSVGLTNRPNLDLKSLNRKQDKQETAKMDKLLQALGLKAGATEAEAIVALNAVEKARDQAVAQMSAAPTLKTHVPRADYDVAINRADKAEGELAEQSKAAMAAEVDHDIKAALEAGKITPATEAYHREQCAQDGGIERFREFAKAAPVVAGDSGLDGRKPPEAGTALNADERKVAELCGLSIEEYQGKA